MKMTLNEIDEQIREVENRIAVERIALNDAVNGCTNSLREAVTSPKTLLALLGVGYAVGKVLFKDKAAPESAPVKKAGMLGLLTGVAGTALSMAGPRLGWGTVAKWAARRYMGGHKVATAAGKPGRPLAVPPPANPYPRTPSGV
jgi:hypothetical protein